MPFSKHEIHPDNCSESSGIEIVGKVPAQGISDTGAQVAQRYSQKKPAHPLYLRQDDFYTLRIPRAGLNGSRNQFASYQNPNIFGNPWQCPSQDSGLRRLLASSHKKSFTTDLGWKKSFQIGPFFLYHQS